MIHDAFRRSVQLAIVARICGRATAVTINSRPARKTPTPRTVRSKYEVRRDIWLSVRALGGRCLDRRPSARCGGVTEAAGAAARCGAHHVTNRPKARLAWLAIVVVLLRLAGAYYSLHAPSYRWANPGGSHARQGPHKPNPTGARPRPDPGDRRLRRELQLNRQRRRWQQL